MFKNIIIAFFVITTLFFAWIACTIKTEPLERAFEQYNHIKIYEDGSYTGEDREGNAVNGCLPNGLCRD